MYEKNLSNWICLTCFCWVKGAALSERLRIQERNFCFNSIQSKKVLWFIHGLCSSCCKLTIVSSMKQAAFVIHAIGLLVDMIFTRLFKGHYIQIGNTFEQRRISRAKDVLNLIKCDSWKLIDTKDTCRHFQPLCSVIVTLRLHIWTSQIFINQFRRETLLVNVGVLLITTLAFVSRILLWWEHMYVVYERKFFNSCNEEINAN